MNELPVVFDETGLIPVVVQDNVTNAVLMLAYMNADALARTRETRRMHYWSRSRQALWKKGETSGNEQIVDSIRINCYGNSLLITVEQIGACCHTGYPTCYFRELTAENNLIAIGEPEFDPEEVYQSGESLHSDLARWVGAYRWLADNDVSTASGTSKLLQSATVDYLATRVVDELLELSGVITGEHRHESVERDLQLESGQILYWATMFAMRSGLSDPELTSAWENGMLAGTSEPLGTLLDRVRDLAADWTNASEEAGDVIRRTGQVTSAAAIAAGVSAHRLIIDDLNELRSKPYLSRYFSTI
jgi:phosphoribosyl-AMP cyclohydrolase